MNETTSESNSAAAAATENMGQQGDSSSDMRQDWLVNEMAKMDSAFKVSLEHGSGQ